MSANLNRVGAFVFTKVSYHMENLVIWIIGGSSVGKTTQARLIHKFFSGLSGKEKMKLHKFTDEEFPYFFTSFNDYSCNLGDLTRGACSGTDTLGKKDQIIWATKKAKKMYPVLVVEGIMATGQWLDFLKDKKTLLLVVHLNVSEEANFKRLRQRRGAKLGIPPQKVQIAEKTRLNLSGKLRTFQRLYDRLAPDVDKHISLDTTYLSPQEVAGKLQKTIEKLILNIK